MVKRVIFFVDGFNLYHSIDELNWYPAKKKYTNSKHHLKWLNIWSLCKALIHPKEDELIEGYYFSAYAGWIDKDAQNRHRSYVKALQSTGIKTMMGTFKKKPRKCPKCKHTWEGHEEKESDVSLAVWLIKLACSNSYDKAIVFTADTDIAPAIRIVKEDFPDKEIRIAIPQRRLNRSNDLINAADGKIRIKESNFSNNLFPEQIEFDGTIIKRPSKYAPLSYINQQVPPTASVSPSTPHTE